MRRSDLKLLCSWLLLGLVWFVANPAFADHSPLGYWTTIDDDGKTPKAVVQIEQRGEKLYGKIVRLIHPDKPNPTCDECEGALKGKPILGLQIMWDFTRDGSEWSGGRILDPNNGKVYKCYIEVVEGGARLKVRGYLGISLLGRTQYWKRGNTDVGK